MQQVTKNVYVETVFRGCNPGFVVTTDGLVLTDGPQRPTDGMKYKKELSTYGDVRYLINTEPHGDHVSSNFLFDAVFIAQKGTRDRMAEKEYLKMITTMLKTVDPEFAQHLDDYQVPLAEITFSESMDLHVGGHRLRLIHLPGHTASETAVFIPEEHAVFTGDNIFHNTATFMHEALPVQWLDSLGRLKKLDAEFYIPGHGEICREDYLDVQISVVKEWMEVIQGALDKGWGLEETQEKVSFLERYSIDDEMKTRVRELEKVGIANCYRLAEEGKI